MGRKGKIILIVLLLLIVVGIGLFIYFNKDEDGVINEIINNFNESSKEMDNRNGIYVYEDRLDDTIRVSSACTLSSFKYYMSIVNNRWFLYKSSCLGTYQLKEGKTEDLKINYDSESKQYSFKYDGNLYVKNDNLRTIIPDADFENTEAQKVQLGGYKTLVKETMFDGHYYKIERTIVGIDRILFMLDYYGGNYVVTFESGVVTAEGEDTLKTYTYSSPNVDDLPDFTSLNKKIVIIDKYTTNNRLNYDLKLFSYEGAIEYSLKDVFPITLNGIQLTPETHYIYVDYDVVKKSYVMLVSEKENFCVSNSKENKVAYYEFKIDIDYVDYSFKTPTFVRTWYERDGCTHYNELVEG